MQVGPFISPHVQVRLIGKTAVEASKWVGGCQRAGCRSRKAGSSKFEDRGFMWLYFADETNNF